MLFAVYALLVLIVGATVLEGVLEAILNRRPVPVRRFRLPRN
jgi:hypothetical protein